MPRLATALFLFTSLYHAQSGCSAASSTELDLRGYLSELDRWGAALAQAKQNPGEAATLRKQLPTTWPVRIEGQRYEVPTTWLRTEFDSIAKHPRAAASCQQIQQRIQALRAEALRLRDQPQPPAAEARRKLGGILKRPEFRNVHGPTWLDQLRDRLALWLLELIQRLLNRTGISPAASRILAWVLIVAAGLVLLVWMVRRLLGRPPPSALVLEASQAAAKTWQDRAREAFAAAERGNFRDAIRLAYWAGVYRLEELGLWKTDRTRTHREYLRLLPPSHPQRDTLFKITSQFELVWYAKRESSADDFKSVIRNLEKLGCVFPSRLATERS